MGYALSLRQDSRGYANWAAGFQLSFEGLASESGYLEGIRRLFQNSEDEDYGRDWMLAPYLRRGENLLPFIVAFRRHNRRVGQRTIDDFLGLWSIDLFREHMSTAFQLMRLHGEAQPDLAGFRAALTDRIEELLEDFQDEIKSQRNYNTLFRYSEDRVDEFPSVKYMMDYIDLMEARYRCEGALHLSNLSGEPVLLTAQSHHPTPSQAEPLKVPTTVDEQSFRVYRIILDNFNFPAIDGLNGLMNLIRNPYVSEFKARVKEWTQALVEDEVTGAARLRLYLARANNELRRVKLRQRKSLDFYLALPLTIYDVMRGTGFSAFTTAYSGWMRLSNYLKKKKYRWLLIGSGT